MAEINDRVLRIKTLRSKRMRLGLTQREAAGMLEITAHALNNYEMNYAMPSCRLLRRYATLLKRCERGDIIYKRYSSDSYFMREDRDNREYASPEQVAEVERMRYTAKISASKLSRAIYGHDGFWWCVLRDKMKCEISVYNKAYHLLYNLLRGDTTCQTDLLKRKNSSTLIP